MARRAQVGGDARARGRSAARYLGAQMPSFKIIGCPRLYKADGDHRSPSAIAITIMIAMTAAINMIAMIAVIAVRPLHATPFNGRMPHLT